MEVSKKQFERAVERALSRIPVEIRRHLKNLAISIEPRPTRELLAQMGIPTDETLFGVYTGVPLPERSVTDPPLYPDEIVIFREPLQDYCRNIEELETEIEITVVHEIAHFLGIDEERLAELGYA